MTELFIILGIFIISYILILRDFKFFLYVLLMLSLLLHKELFSFYHWDLMPIRGAMLAVLCAGLTRVYLDLFRDKNTTNLQRVLKNPFFVLVLLLWFVRALSVFYSKNLNASLLLLGFFTTVVSLVYLLIVNLSGKKEDIRKYLDFYILCVFGLTLFGYFQYYLYAKTEVIIGALWNIPGNIPRVGATFWDVNHYGALIASLLPVVGIYILIRKGWKQKIKYIAIFSSLFVALILTNSRTAWMIDITALLVFSTLLLVKKFGRKGIGIIFIVVSLITLPMVKEYQDKASPFRARIKHYFHYRIDSFDSHFMLLTGAYQIFEKFPFIGGGYGSFFEHFSKTEIAPTYFGRDPAALNTRVPAHTIWGELIAETGAVGLSIYILFTIVISSTLYYAYVKARDWRESFVPAAMLSSFVGWMVAGIFYSYNTEFFWIILTLYFLYGMSVFGEKYLAKNLVNKFFKSKGLMALTLVALGAFLIFGGLGKTHLIPWDEAIYAKIAKNMVVNNEFFTMSWQPETIWFEKPPMYMWFMALSMKLLGVTSLAARLPSAILGFGTVIIVYLFAKKMFDKTTGFLAGFILLTTFQFLYYSRASMTDVSVTFFITLSLYLYYLLRSSGVDLIEKKRNLIWVLSGLSIGMAIMIKGIIGFLPFGIIGLNELYLILIKQVTIDKKLIKSYLLCFFTSILVFLPWHMYMYFKYGQSFIDNYLVYHVISRATTAIEEKGKPFFWYLVVLRVSMRLWYVWLLFAFPLAIYHTIKGDNKNRFLLIWAIPIFLFFSVAKSKLVWYIMPLYPVLAIIVGFAVHTCIRFLMNRVRVFNNSVPKFLVIYALIIFVLTYLFLNKGLIYTGDLTGSQARLLQLKDEVMGTQEKMFLDRIEYPLALFYTDSPFEIMDISPDTGRFPTMPYEKKLIVLAKRGRYENSLPLYDNSDVVGEDGDWVLWYYPSGYELDKKSLRELNDSINEYSSKTQTNQVRKRLQELVDERDLLEHNIELLLVQDSLLQN